MLETIFLVASVLSFVADGWLYRRHADPSRPRHTRRACGAALVGLLLMQLGIIAWVAVGRGMP